MEIWKWFKGIWSANHTKGRRNRKKLDPRIAQAFSRVKRNIKTLKTDLADTNAQLARQNSRIAKNTRLINNHNSRLNELEDIVSTGSITPPLQKNPTNRPSHPTSRLVATKPTQVESLERLDMDSITEQEKKIIGVFLDHHDMSLSYQDIAKSLDKSPYTVKNQMRQMNMKADLFDRIVDSQNKNRFKLRKYLKVETKLNTD